VARTSLTVQDIDRTGLTPSFSAANADGHEIDNDAILRTFLYVKNGGGGGITVTVVTSETRDGLAVADLTVSVGAGADSIIGPFPPAQYDQTDDTVDVDFSGVTSVTVAAFKLASS
jgi:hypothetical protein